ncbi:MAG: hypothetical protein IPM24_24740 [Bryobacterales bacterium]|nr:hypothetical protein [Bryobacterales bacterium]
MRAPVLASELRARDPVPLPLLRIVLFLAVIPAILPGQRTSLGFVGGTNLTRDFPLTRTAFPDPAFPAGPGIFDLYSDTNSFIAGPSLSLALTKSFSFEASALHRNLYLKRRTFLPGGQRLDGGQYAIGTWQWPLLLKYRAPVGALRPFVEAGPSFRTRKNPGATEPSQRGVSQRPGSRKCRDTSPVSLLNWIFIRASPSRRTASTGRSTQASGMSPY